MRFYGLGWAAFGWILGGAFLGVVFPLVAQLVFGQDQSLTEGPTALVAVQLLSLLLVAIGVWAGFRDVWWLRTEWSALSVREFSTPTAVPAGRARGDTIADRLDARVQRLGALGGTHHAPRDGLLSLVHGGAARIGGLTRFLAATLLLMAVVGTFLGMRHALPQLQDALGQAIERGPASDDSLRQALKMLSEAFGANLLAILGSVALGSMSFTAIRERSSLTAELVAYCDERLLPRMALGLDASAVERLVSELKGSVREMTGVGTELGELRRELYQFSIRLDAALHRTEETVRAQPLQDLLRGQTELIGRVGLIAEGIQSHAEAAGSSAAAYQGLVEGFRTRDFSLETAARGLESTAQSAGEAAAGVAVRIDQVAGTLGRLSEALSHLTTEFEQQARQLHAARTEEHAAVTSVLTDLRVEFDSLRAASGELLGHLDAIRGLQAATNDAVSRIPEATAQLSHDVREAVPVAREIRLAVESASLATNDLLVEVRGPAAGQVARVEEALGRLDSRLDTFGGDWAAALRLMAEAMQGTHVELARLRQDLIRALAATDQGRGPGGQGHADEA